MSIDTSARGYTTREVAARFRVGAARVLAWIARGELRAINRRDTRSGRPSWVVTAEALTEFERGRAATPPPKPPRRKKRTTEIDFFPD